MRITRGKVVGVAVLIILAAALMLALAGGCESGNLTRLSDEQLYARTTTANEARMTPEGNLQASYQGIGATQAMADPNGAWAQMQGPAAIINFPLNNGVAQMFSPKDVIIRNLKYTPEPKPGAAALEIGELTANISVPMAQDVAALQVALPLLAEMSKAEALAAIEKWRIAGTMMPTIADALIKIISLWAPVGP